MATTEMRAALVTGCSRSNGMGAASALALARNGVSVVVCDIAGGDDSEGGTNADNLQRLVETIAAAGGKAAWAQGDVSSQIDTERLVADVVSRFGSIDILVNNAAAPHGADRVEIEDIPASEWDRVMGVNARGPFLLSRAAIPHMRKRHWGRIINVASAIVGQPRRRRALYSASKHAVVGLTEALAIDLGESGITVNAVCPGSVLTARAVSTALRSGFADPREAFAETARTIPVGRHGEAGEIAGLIAYLASEQAGYITGQAIRIDGGGLPNYTR